MLFQVSHSVVQKTLKHLLSMDSSADLNILISQGVQEADKPGEGFYIRSGITIILKNATIEDGTII